MRRSGRNRLSAVLQRLEREAVGRAREYSHPFDGGRHRIRIASDLESRRRAYRLVYDLYVGKGYAERHPSRMWLSLFDALPETATFLVERADGTAAGALTVVFDSPLGLPADELYGSEIAGLRSAGGRPCEFVSLGVAEPAATGRTVLVELFSFISTFSREIRGATDIVITVNPRHQAFYRRTLLFDRLGPERSCPKVGGAPAVLMRLDLALERRVLAEAHSPLGARDYRRTFYPRFHPPSDEAAMVAGMRRSHWSMTEEELRYFFIGETDVLAGATPEQRRFIEGCYPCCDLDPVTSDTRSYLPV